MAELIDRCHTGSCAYIYIIKRLLSHACLGSTLHHDTVEFTVAVEVRGIETAIVTLQCGEHHAGRDASLLTLGHIDMNHVLRIVRVVTGLSTAHLRPLIVGLEEVLNNIVELVQVATSTVLHDNGNTV